MNCNIAVIKGDGVGPEIIDEGIKVLNKIVVNLIIDSIVNMY